MFCASRGRVADLGRLPPDTVALRCPAVTSWPPRRITREVVSFRVGRIALSTRSASALFLQIDAWRPPGVTSSQSSSREFVLYNVPRLDYTPTRRDAINALCAAPRDRAHVRCHVGAVRRPACVAVQRLWSAQAPSKRARRVRPGT